MGKSLVEMAAGLVQAQCAVKGMDADELAASLQATFRALVAMQQAEEKLQTGVAASLPGDQAVSELNPKASIQKHKIVCLECGHEARMLSSKHLASHKLTGREYRKKWGFSARQPLCAKSLTESRKKAGKERGISDNLRSSMVERKKTPRAKKTVASK